MQITFIYNYRLPSLPTFHIHLVFLRASVFSVVNSFTMSTVYLALTSLAGDRAANLLRAFSAIFIGNMHLNSASSIYEIQNGAGDSIALTVVISLSAERLEAFSLKKYLPIHRRPHQPQSPNRTRRTLDRN